MRVSGVVHVGARCLILPLLGFLSAFCYLDSERGNFKLFGHIYPRKFELFGARLLKKRGFEWFVFKVSDDISGTCTGHETTLW